jgi:hypothetical protein
MADVIVTTWRYVRPGHTVHVKGVAWMVVQRDPWILQNPVHGRRDGMPRPDDTVQVAEPREDPTMTMERAAELVRARLGGREVP